MLSYINVGIGEDCIICELVEIVVKVIGFKGNIVWDIIKFDGVFRKLMNVFRFYDLGWKYIYDLECGL